MRKLIIPILVFMACNDQPSQKATTNIQRSEFGFDNLKGKPETIDSKTVNFDPVGLVAATPTVPVKQYLSSLEN